MVSDSDLVTRLREVLRRSDLETATPASVRRQLEADFGVDLTDRKAFIRDQIDSFLESDGGGEEPDGHKAEEEGDANAKTEVVENDAVDAEEEGDNEEDDEGSDGDEGKKERPGKVKKRRGGFNKLCQLSPQLEKFVGASQMARTEVVKKIWAYIRENNLQDPKNKRNIICDESLHSLFRVKTIDMFKMNKALSKHIWPLSDGDGCINSLKEENEDGESGEMEENGEQNEEVEENNEEDSEEELPDRRKRTSKRKKSSKADEKTKKRGGGFCKLCSLSPELQAFTGVPQLARTEVVKMLWGYIKENNLQDPSDKRKIICDESLRTLFPVDSINMFQMNKQLSKHIWPLEEDEGRPDNSPKRGKQKQEIEEDSDEPKEIDKRKKKGGSGLTVPVPLSDALVKFLGTGENSLSRADVVKRIWDYIKQNDLQDPSDKRMILCDEKLKELFEIDSFRGFSVSKLLTNHFIKTEQ